jgi:hypothetical protein
MPKVDIDYSNTIIYKIACKDISITELYVGHTTNFVQRKHAHKQSCINLKAPCYNSKLYKTIRECGGWNNWEMTIVNFYNCKSHLEAREKEQEHFISLGATLNSIYPLPNKIMPEKVLTDISNNDKPILDNTSHKFVCELCHYNTINKKDWNKHIVTNKHIKQINPNLNSHKKSLSISECKCGKKYKHRSSLSFHKKTCIIKNTEITDKELIASLLKQNTELIEQNAIFLKNAKIISNVM